MNYTHLTREERYQIHALRRRKVAITAIAADLGRPRSTIVRELARNATPKGAYNPAQAHTQAKQRLSGPGNVRTIGAAHWALVVRCLVLGLSPQQISGRFRIEKQPPIIVSGTCTLRDKHGKDDEVKAGDVTIVRKNNRMASPTRAACPWCSWM